MEEKTFSEPDNTKCNFAFSFNAKASAKRNSQISMRKVTNNNKNNSDNNLPRPAERPPAEHLTFMVEIIRSFLAGERAQREA